MAKYTNAWLTAQSNRWEPDLDRFTVQTGPDPGHGDFSEPSNAVIMQDAPPAEAGGDIVTDATWENAKNLPPGFPIDKTPIDHRYGGFHRPFSQTEPRSSLPDTYPGYGRGFLGFLRGRDDGAATDQTTQVEEPQFFNEQYFGVTTDGYAPPPITQEAGEEVLRRGLNAYPENNGTGGRTRDGGPNIGSSWRVPTPSWKIGSYYLTNVNRDFTPPNRTHDNARFNRPDIVTIIGDAPPPMEPDKYASPFSSLAKFLPKRRQIRGIRRIPGAFDEPSIVDYTPPVEMPSVDGMIVF